MSVASRTKDYFKDLVGFLLPPASLVIPVGAAMAYMEGMIGFIPMAASLVLMIAMLRVMAVRHDYIVPDRNTLLSPFVFLVTIAHYILLMMVGVVGACYLIIILIGAGQGEISIPDTAMIAVFFFANAAYVFSFYED
ncbi:hypothetical protein [Sulfitobacter sp. R18_1]|uniref:hypothetical protein n=1 Tax=Sulfitobacter sp. R18_1 TaxID=2821104 RepID=UPI001ADAA5E7|nr:hypothetical protein [Sulfitobacter sp. R18_1]MBO9428173.1 hypothetical protein [Sulfitobacter sp. R18_1]